MTDKERIIITSVWNYMGLRMRLQDDPYSLTQDELMALKSNDQLNSKLNGFLKDAFVQRAVLPARNHWHKL